MTRLILIRHGETDYNLQNKYCGFSNQPLNKNGIWQSKRLAGRLANLKVEKVYSSDLKRTVETAKIIFKHHSIEQLADFREMNFGIFEGLKYDEIVEEYPGLYKNWINNPTKVKIPDGEALEDLAERVRKRLAFLLSQNKDKEITLVTHGGPIRVIFCDALKFGPDSFWNIKQDIAAINIIDYPKNSSPTVVKMNDTSHLAMQEVTAL